MVTVDASRFRRALASAWSLRAPLHAVSALSACRIVDGAGDGLPGLYVDRYGPALVFSVYDDAGLSEEDVTAASHAMLDVLQPEGVESVYVKRFVRDRSRLGGQAPAETRASTPRAGRPQPETLVVREYGAQFEVRLYDGFSTGLFLEHREHRRALAAMRPARALNLFAYTCGFSVPLASAGAQVVNVDVSQRYLDWGRRNIALNALPADRVRYHRMDALEYLTWAARRAETRFDLVILDPPTFAAGDPRRGRRPWRAASDYPALVEAAVRVLAREGVVFAATNARELAAPGALAQMVREAIGRSPRWLTLPPWPIDVREPGRVAAVLFSPR